MEIKVRRVGIFEDLFDRPLILMKYRGKPVLKKFILFLAGQFGEPFSQKIFAEGGSYSSDVVILLNGRSINSLKRGDMTPISDGDEVVFTVMFAGG